MCIACYNYGVEDTCAMEGARQGAAKASYPDLTFGDDSFEPGSINPENAFTSVTAPSSTSPVRSVQGTYAYGDGNDATTTDIAYNLYQFSDTDAWTSTQETQMEAALAVWETVANIDFQRTTSSLIVNNDMIFGVADGDWFQSATGSSNVLGFMNGPQTAASNGYAAGIMNTSWWTDSNGASGGYFFRTLMHEIGHGLGLGHTHDTGFGSVIMNGVTAAHGDTGDSDLNQGIYTVMSYNRGWYSEYGSNPSSSATYAMHWGLGAIDIAAVQAMYGANMSYATGNDSYALFTSNTAGTSYGAIWDAGGTDAITYAGSGNATINLNAANLSSYANVSIPVSYVEGIQGGFTIAQGAVIENATSGSGNDILTGNEYANTLTANAGNDSLFGGDGIDLLYGGDGIDTLFGGQQDDILFGGDQNDTLDGGSGLDALYGDGGDDTFLGSFGADSIFGGTGDDQLNLSSTHYKQGAGFYGGDDTDTLFLANGLPSDLIRVDQGGGVENLLSATVGGTLIQVADVEQLQAGGAGPITQLSDLNTLTGQFETSGSVTTLSNGSYFAYEGSMGFNVVTYNGVAVTNATFAGWSFLGVEDTGTGGAFQAFWQHDSYGYRAWDLTDSGGFIHGNVIADIIAQESAFGGDLNGDGLVGHGNYTVENTGGVELQGSTTTGLYSFYPGLAGPFSVKDITGTDVGANSFAGWSAVGIEGDGAGGYHMLWQNVSGTFSHWQLDSTGQATSYNAGVDAYALEVTLNIDLTGDGTIGHGVKSWVEQTGTADLGISTYGHYVVNNGGPDLMVTDPSGGAVTPDSYAGWSALGVAELPGGGGFAMAWKNDDGRYSLWRLDANGQRVDAAISDATAMGGYETLFAMDYNGINGTETVTNWIEQTGTISLGTLKTGVMMLSDGGTEAAIRYNGDVLFDDSLTGWTAQQAIEIHNGAGYRMLWQDSTGRFAVWDLDAYGGRQSGGIVDARDYETEFNLDINGTNGIEGASAWIEQTGTADLGTRDTGAYVITKTGAPEITLRGPSGEIARTDTYLNWTAQAVETQGANYLVLWQNSVTGQQNVWTVDAAGVFVTSAINVNPAVAYPGVFDSPGPDLLGGVPDGVAPSLIDPSLIDPAALDPGTISPLVIGTTGIDPDLIDPGPVLDPIALDPGLITPAMIDPGLEGSELSAQRVVTGCLGDMAEGDGDGLCAQEIEALMASLRLTDTLEF